MKSTDFSKLLPQWTKLVVTDISGRDPLGLARVATNIADYLMPGVVVATDRARYFALYSWILANIRATESPTTEVSFAEAFQRRETAIAIATLLIDRESSPVGKRAVERELEKAEADIRTDFKVLPSNELGGYGQYYSGSLYNLGLTHRPEGQFDQVTDRGARLAEEISKTLLKTPWAAEESFRKRRVPLDVLTKSASRLSINAIKEPFAARERSALIDVLFDFDSEESGVPSLRRQSLARLLDLVRAYEAASMPVGPSEDVTLDDQLVLGPGYYGFLVDEHGKSAVPYRPPPFLAANNGMWRQFCLHELTSWVLESVLSAMLALLGDSPETAFTLDDVVEALSGAALVDGMKALARVSCASPRDLLAALGIQTAPDGASCQKARRKFSLSSSLNEDALMRANAPYPVALMARALPCLALLYAKWRDGSDDEAWVDVREKVEPELAAATVLPRVDSWLAATTEWSDVVRELIELVLRQHDRIMYEKGRLESCWIHREGDRLVPDQDYGVGYPAHASRQRTAMSLLVDIGLLNVDDQGRYATTPEGKMVMLHAQELGR
jgi:hypothetical protein